MCFSRHSWSLEYLPSQPDEISTRKKRIKTTVRDERWIKAMLITSETTVMLNGALVTAIATKEGFLSPLI